MQVRTPQLALMAAAVLTLGNRHFRINCDEPDRALAGGGAGTGTAVADPTQAVVDAVAGRIDQSLTPILQRVTQLEGRLAAATQAQSGSGVNPGQFLQGRAPAGHTGERASTSRGYQMQRVIGLRQGFYSADQCKVEMDVHQRLHHVFVEQGGMTLEGHNSILIPMSAAYMPTGAESLGSEIQQMMRQGVAGADIQQAAAMIAEMRGISIQQALSIYDDTAGGVFLGPTQQGDMIDLIRNREVFSRVGARSLPLPPNGRLSLPRHTGTGTAYWVGESKTITDSQMSTGMMTLAAKKLAMIYKLPNELLRFAMAGSEAFVRNDMAMTLSLGADSAFMSAAGTQTTPKGLLNYSGIKSVDASTVDTNGNTLEPQDLGRLIGKIEDANHDTEALGWAWVMRPGIWWDIYNRRADAVTAGDKRGPFVFSVNRNDISSGRPASLMGSPWVRSNQVPSNRAKGSATNLTLALGGCFSQFLIGRVGVLEVATNNVGDTPFTTDQTWLRMIQHIDGAPIHESAFGIIDKLVDPNRA
jgi:HK97 family phage major capsid protein